MSESMKSISELDALSTALSAEELGVLLAAYLEIRNESEEIPLSAEQQHRAQLFLKAGAVVDEYLDPPIFIRAILKRAPQLALDILEITQNPDVSLDQENAFLLACYCTVPGQTETIIALLNQMIEINPDLVSSSGYKGRNALHYAAEGRNAELMAFLVDELHIPHVADYRGSSPLIIAAAHGDSASVEALLHAGVSSLDPESDEPFARGTAEEMGQTHIVELLRAAEERERLLRSTPQLQEGRTAGFKSL